MDQIRQLRFEDFRDEKLEQRYQEVLERSWGPNTENEINMTIYSSDLRFPDPSLGDRQIVHPCQLQ